MASLPAGDISGIAGPSRMTCAASSAALTKSGSCRRRALMNQFAT